MLLLVFYFDSYKGQYFLWHQLVIQVENLIPTSYKLV